MRGSVIVAVVILALAAARGMAQEASVPAMRAADGGTDTQAVLRQPASPSIALQDRVRQWMERIRPLQDRLVEDDRLRTAATMVGVGIAAYEASRAQSGLPIGAIGAEALRLG